MTDAMPAADRLSELLVAALLALAVALAVRTLADPRAERDEFLFNADFLSPAALYQDVFVTGHGWRSFAVSPANFGVPDYVAYFAVRAVVGDTAAAVLPWAGLLFALLVLAAWAAMRQTLPPPARRSGRLVLGLWLAAYFAVNALHLFHSQARELLMPVSHAGALTLALLGFAVSLRYHAATPQGRVGWWLLLAAVCVPGFFSDRWLGFWLAVPLAVAQLGRPLRPAVGVLAAVAAGAAGGLWLLRRFTGPTDAMDGFWTGFLWDGLADRAARLARVLGEEIAAGNVLVLAGLAWQPVAAAVVVRRRANPAIVPYCLFSLTATLLTVSVFLVSRLSVTHFDHPWPLYSRYFLGPLGLGFFGWPVVLAGPSARVVVRRYGLPVAVLVAVVAATPRSATVDLNRYRPAYVAAVDDACRRYGLRDGLGGYAEAKPVTLLSAAGVRVVPVAADERSPDGVSAFHWLNNARDFWQRSAGDPEPVRFQFVIARDGVLPTFGQSAAGVVRAFGEPVERVPVGPGLTLLVYGRPADTALSRFPELDAQTKNLRFRFDGGPVRYPGVSLGGGPPDEPGLLAFGPGLPVLTAGRYRATFRVTATAAGRVDVVLTKGGDGRSLAHAVVAPGADREYTLDVDLGRDTLGGRLDFAAFQTVGRGLTLHDVEFAAVE